MNKFCRDHKINYSGDTEYLYEKVSKLFDNDEYDENEEDHNMLHWIATYYREKENFEKMKEYGWKAINKGNIYQLNNLGHYYLDIKDYTTAKELFDKSLNHAITINDRKNIFYTKLCILKYYTELNDEEELQKLSDEMENFDIEGLFTIENPLVLQCDDDELMDDKHFIDDVDNPKFAAIFTPKITTNHK